MKNVKLYLPVALLLSTLLLTACDEYDENINLNTDTDAQVGTVVDDDDVNTDSETDTSNGTTKNAELTHKSTTQYDYTLKTSYTIPNSKNGWKFTYPSRTDLAIMVESAQPDLEFVVTNIYADVSVLSNNLTYHGVRQDSLFVDYASLSSDGINFNEKTAFKIPFQIEGINQNEHSVMVINGYGSSSTYRLTESTFAEKAQGGVLNVVWTVLVKNTKTQETFSESITHAIGLPTKKADQ